MPVIDTTWYYNFGNGTSTGYFAIPMRAPNTAYAAGQIVRQFTPPTVNNERAFVCIIAGTSAAAADATWVLTRGAKTIDNTVTWMECTGQPAVNGDLVNTATWQQAKINTPAALGQIIKRSNNASYQICTTAGAMSAVEPTMSDTAGVTTTDTTAVWTSMGPVGNFTGGMAPHARITAAGAANWFASGNTIYVHSASAETMTSLTWAPTGALNTIGKLLCHNGANYPPGAGNLTTGATVTTTTGVLTLNNGFPFYFYGVMFQGGNGASSNVSMAINGAGATWMYFDNCVIRLMTANVNPSIFLGNSGTNTVIFNNTKVFFADPGQSISVACSKFIWQNTSPALYAGSAIPATFIAQTSGGTNLAVILLEALDLTQISTNIFSLKSGNGVVEMVVKDCKLHASALVQTPPNTGCTIQLARSAP